jgi:hypothetical protein
MDVKEGVGGPRGRYVGMNITWVPLPVIVIFLTGAHINPRIGSASGAH